MRYLIDDEIIKLDDFEADGSESLESLEDSGSIWSVHIETL